MSHCKPAAHLQSPLSSQWTSFKRFCSGFHAEYWNREGRKHKATDTWETVKGEDQTQELGFQIKLILSSKFYYKIPLYPGCPGFHWLLYEPVPIEHLQPGHRERSPASSQVPRLTRRFIEESRSWLSSLVLWIQHPGWIFLGFGSLKSLQGAQITQWNSPDRRTLPS